LGDLPVSIFERDRFAGVGESVVVSFCSVVRKKKKRREKKGEMGPPWKKSPFQGEQCSR
jgi:hypothetical protein